MFYTEKQPDWLQWIAPSKFEDKDLYRMVIFYLFHAPCEGSSYMQKSLKEYGWNTPWRKPYKLNVQLKQASTNSELIYSTNTLENMNLVLNKANLDIDFPVDLTRERIAIYDCKKNQFQSIFYHIRNAFAHCRLNMVDINGECVFILEDVSVNKSKGQFRVSARMILKKRTLLNWIDIIEGGEKKLII